MFTLEKLSEIMSNVHKTFFPGHSYVSHTIYDMKTFTPKFFSIEIKKPVKIQKYPYSFLGFEFGKQIQIVKEEPVMTVTLSGLDLRKFSLPTFDIENKDTKEKIRKMLEAG